MLGHHQTSVHVRHLSIISINGVKSAILHPNWEVDLVILVLVVRMFGDLPVPWQFLKKPFWKGSHGNVSDGNDDFCVDALLILHHEGCTSHYLF